MGDGDVTRIDRQAWAWRKKLIEVRCGQDVRKPGIVSALFLHHGMSQPLPWDRLELIQAATRREEPSWEAFVSLALVDYLEDREMLPIDERTAKLPYQLAWVRAGFTLTDTTGLPSGVLKATWPDVELGAIEPRREPRVPAERIEPGDVRELRLAGHPDPPEQLRLLDMPGVPKGRRGAYGDPSTA